MDKDIFDRIMELPVLRLLQPLYRRYKEILLYLFFGVLTTVVSIAVYALFSEGLKWSPLTANILSWIAAVLFAYMTNRTWVFHQKPTGVRNTLRQMLTFYGGRVFTLILEEAILWIGINALHFPNMIVKVFAQILVIIGNYVISKVLVFRKDKKKPTE